MKSILRSALTHLPVIVSVALGTSTLNAAELKSFGDSSTAYATGITVTPGGPLLFTSGGGAGKMTGDTKAQALVYFANLKTSLEGYGFSLSDIAFVHAALVPDENGKVDRDGWDAAWREIFGTSQMPTKPALTTIVLPKLWGAGSTVGELDCIVAAGSLDKMVAASKALNLPVTNEALTPFETRKNRFYAAMGVKPGTSLFWASGAGAPIANKTADIASRESRGDMHTQATNTLKAIEANLATVGLSFKDVVFMRAYVGPDTFDGGKFDYDGWNKTYDEYFNTASNPHKPARTTIAIAGFGNPSSMLEVEVVAAFPSEPTLFASPDAGNSNLKTFGKPEAPIASGIAVKGGSTYHFSAGAGPSVGGDLKAQALSALGILKTRLEAAGFGLKDVVFLHAFVVGDDKGKVDRAGWAEAYLTYFGTPTQPHKPARTTVAVSGLSNSEWKIELEVVAAKP